MQDIKIHSLQLSLNEKVKLKINDVAESRPETINSPDTFCTSALTWSTKKEKK